MSDETEIWKPVVGYEGLYEVSDLGRIKRLKRVSMIGKVLKEKLLKPSDTNGYLYVSLSSQSGVRKTLLTHRLVAATFIGKIPEGHDVCHSNGIRSDNRVLNLRYGTRSENMKEAVAHGSLSGSDRSYYARITIDQVKKVKAMLKLGFEFEEISESVLLSVSDSRRAAYGKRYKIFKSE